MISAKQTARTYAFLFFSIILAFVYVQRALFKEYTEMHRLHLHAGIVWCCEALFVLGIVSLFLGSRTIAGKAEVEHSRRASASFGVGILAVFLSMVIQFSVWETIGKYSMFYAQQHATQSIPESLNQ